MPFTYCLSVVNFRMSSHEALEHHFKVLSQYFIHLIVSGPSFVKQSQTSYFRVALSSFRKKISSTKDSSVTSSVWPTRFKNALEKYPEFGCEMLEEAVPGCDACKIGGRLSKYLGRCSGDPYDKQTFQDIVEDEEEDSDEDEEEEDLKGPYKLGKKDVMSFSSTSLSNNPCIDELRLLTTGRFCRARAEIFHDFSHWGEQVSLILTTHRFD